MKSLSATLICAVASANGAEVLLPVLLGHDAVIAVLFLLQCN